MAHKQLKLFFLILAVTLTQRAFAIQPSVSEVKDSRTTGKFFAACEIELALVGDEIGDAKSVRTVIQSATDDTGRNLLDTEHVDSDFHDFSSFGSKSVTLKLKNPARKAVSIKEILGQLTLYSPKLDPDSTLKIQNPLSLSAKPISNSTLSSLGIEFTLYTSTDYAAYQKQQAEKSAAGALGNSIGNALGQMMGGGNANDITFIVTDPSKKIVSYDFVLPTGVKVQARSWMTSNNIRTISYQAPIPPEANLEISLLTDKSSVAVPLQLHDIALP